MDKKRASYLEGAVSIFLNIALFFLKFWAGVVSGSIALTADAWHTLSDSISSLVVIVGAKLSSKEADKDHPYGHGRTGFIHYYRCFSRGDRYWFYWRFISAI